MQGHTTDNTANIWLMVKQNQDSLNFELLNDKSASINVESTCHRKWCTYNLSIKGITKKENQLKITTELAEQLFNFTASNAAQKTSFSFLLGSCTFRWGPLLPIAPSNGYKIFRAMSEHESDLMLWLGDNVYYLLRDHKNEALRFRENAKNRKKKAMASFIQDKQHYAIWDDHDFGPNNCAGDYEKKDISKKVFDQFWANPENNNEGNYFSFQYANAEFFMLDSRWFKIDSENQPNEMLGQEQLEWLIEGLKSSPSTFKFISLGSQIINPTGVNGERFPYYKEEYNALLKIASEMENVIFLSGDMHYSTVFQNDNFDKNLYEFSCSPLSSMRYKIRKKNDEYQNPYFVQGTQYHKQNFGKVTVEGDQCTFEVFDRKGVLIWSYKLP